MFASFFSAGFEGSTGFRRDGSWFDQVAATGHEALVDKDYAACARIGLMGARESVRWPLVDAGHGRYDFSSLVPFLDAARRHDVGVVWDLFHYGYPSDLDIWSRDFTSRFADYCYATARFVARHSDGTCRFTPVNEPSFLAYAGGDAAMFAPHATGRGFELKVALVRAAIAGIDAIRAACPRARIVNVDPLCRVVPPRDRPDLVEAASRFNSDAVFQAWDMLCGRLMPELGGSPAHLDVVGVNYYWTCQWEFGGAAGPDGVIPPLAEDDERRAPLRDLVGSVWQRYKAPIMVTETAHFGDRRGPWLTELAREAEALLRDGVPLVGVCLYPVHGMPDWHEPNTWLPMGLWNPADPADPCRSRALCPATSAALAAAGHLDDLYASVRDDLWAQMQTPQAARRLAAADRDR